MYFVYSYSSVVVYCLMQLEPWPELVCHTIVEILEGPPSPILRKPIFQLLGFSRNLILESMMSLLYEGRAGTRVTRPCQYKGPTGINSLLSPLSRSAESETEKIQTEIRKAELDNELHSLEIRIFKREITPVISHLSHIVLLSQGLRHLPQLSRNTLVVIDLDCRNDYPLIYLSQQIIPVHCFKCTNQSLSPKGLASSPLQPHQPSVHLHLRNIIMIDIKQQLNSAGNS